MLGKIFILGIPMHSIKRTVVFLSLILSCTDSAADSRVNTHQQELVHVLDSFHQAAAQANGDKYFSLLADDAVFIGTDAKERWNKVQFEDFANPYFSQGKGWTYLPRDRHITFANNSQVAWFDELLDNKNYGECRGTGVLVKRGERWLISQYHLTIPLPNALAGEFVERIVNYKEQQKE
jgi:hypothetical protein